MLTPKQLRALRATTISGAGNRIAAARALVGETQCDVAQRTGLTQSYLSDVERGRFNTITLENAQTIADHFGCAVDDLFPSKRQAVA